eukprot:2903296-Rhodomonas_salina.1
MLSRYSTDRITTAQLSRAASALDHPFRPLLKGSCDDDPVMMMRMAMHYSSFSDSESSSSDDDHRCRFCTQYHEPKHADCEATVSLGHENFK